MGFFKDLGTLQRQANEMHRNTDVKATMANATAQMQAATAMMAQQTAGAHLATTGADATATIAGVRPTGMQVNFSPIVELDLTIVRNGIPMPLTVRETVPQVALARLRVGETLRAKVDPNQPGLAWLDWYSPA